MNTFLTVLLTLLILWVFNIIHNEEKYHDKRDKTFLDHKNNNKLNNIKCYNGKQYIFIDGLPTYVIKDPRSNTEVTC